MVFPRHINPQYFIECSLGAWLWLSQYPNVKALVFGYWVVRLEIQWKNLFFFYWNLWNRRNFKWSKLQMLNCQKIGTLDLKKYQLKYVQKFGKRYVIPYAVGSHIFCLRFCLRKTSLINKNSFSWFKRFFMRLFVILAHISKLLAYWVARETLVLLARFDISCLNIV